jgi:hypothetical protein
MLEVSFSDGERNISDVEVHSVVWLYSIASRRAVPEYRVSNRHSERPHLTIYRASNWSKRDFKLIPADAKASENSASGERLLKIKSGPLMAF